MINLPKLAEQQKNRRVLKSKNRKLKQTHDIKLVKTLSPIIKKLKEGNDTTKQLGELIENNKLQPAIEHTLPPEPKEFNGVVIYDTELEITLKNMKNNTGFFQSFEDQEHGWMWNGYLDKILGGTEVQINVNIFNITTGNEKVLVGSS